MINFMKLEQSDLRSPHVCEGCRAGLKVGATVLKIRLSNTAPFDMRTQYIHMECLRQAYKDADSSAFTAPAEEVTDILDIIDGLTAMVLETA